MTQPDILTIPFGENAAPETINPIPSVRQPGDDPQQATWSDGFPRVTMQPLVTGGIPPKGQDFNGILKSISEHIVFQNSGGHYKWSGEWVAEKGGYPIGAVLLSDDSQSAYVNIVEGNATNFNTNPAAIGVSWLPFAGSAIKTGTASSSITIMGVGALTGGGSLAANRTIDASPATKASLDKADNALQKTDLVQFDGTSETKVMSQAATTRALQGRVLADHIKEAGFAGGDKTKPFFRHTDDEYVELLTQSIGYAWRSVGIGQAWGDFTESRSRNTWFMNNTGRPITISIHVRDLGSSPGAINIHIGTAEQYSDFPLGDPHSANEMAHGCYVVPNGQSYRILVPDAYAIERWNELR